MRTLIYARYSSAIQNPRSIADQFAACRARAEAEGWEIVAEFSDAAISGAAGIEDVQRPGLAALLDRIDRHDIDQVLTESTDRIARHQGDAFAVRERIEFAGARLFTLMDGVVDDITGTIKGLFDARTRKDLASRVRRGHRGNIAQGKATGGIAYGYRKVARFDDKGEAIRGLREIDEDKAEIVRRIFREYAAGRSPIAIAMDLNAEGVAAPRGAIWRPSTIIGHHNAGFAILANPVYIGRLVYGRSKQVTDPRTRQRRMAPGDGELHTGEAPHLRIVDDTLWHAVQAQLQARSSHAKGASRPERQRRPKHLLSGLGECGVCGSKFIMRGGGYFGCSRFVDAKACSNDRTIQKDRYEAAVLAQLRGLMLAPEAVEAYLEEYRVEAARRAREAAGERGRLERRRAEAARKVERLVDAVAAGGSAFAEIRTALATAKTDQAEAERALAAAEAVPTIALHPGLARQYREAIANLADELADETTRREAAPKLRKLIARIVVSPSEEQRGVTIEVLRHLDEIVTLATRRTA
ncbi:recombinase family protein [Aurantiacibacter luteus]|uniref:Recombinase n=1 Tax=Aurantiacibacter luteus TaxID=1581420 RepID=A0A0G9MP01_9SPHN|nr:recombinase family protein [Aurantiacibacter luteus]KLE32435.1 recombinase [Aurantiacibacter luteus]